MIADFEDLQESDAAEMYVNRFSKTEKYSHKKLTNFHVQTELWDFLVDQVRHCQQRETMSEKMTVTSKMGAQKGRTTEGSWSTNGGSVFRHHAEPRLTLDDQDIETFPIPLKHVDVMKQIQNSINSVSGNIVNDV